MPVRRLPPSERLSPGDVPPGVFLPQQLGAAGSAVLRLVAEYGVLDTDQVAVALGMSRPTAHRRLTALTDSGLLYRSRENSRSHRNRYELAPDGLATMAVWMSRDRRLHLPDLAQRAHPLPGGRGKQDVINRFFLAVAEHGRRAGTGVLHRWLHRVDANRWLADQGLRNARCDGYGVYVTLDDDAAGTAAAVAFTLHWAVTHTPGDDPRGNPALDPAVILAGYDRSVRLDVALVVTAGITEEADWLAYAVAHAVPVRIATTSEDLLRIEPDGPAGPIWATANSVGDAGSHRVRLSGLSSGR
ncbi:replication-relaxation family protein [Cryptosporangium japonicum]|uniref:Uncharacterized protein n=1 Tax=Cryptosporangium japonicum TaxID=80872 RepID=A0ABN0UY10_9ACTN